MRLLTTKRFERDLRLCERRGKNLDKLWTVVDLLLRLIGATDPHRLSGVVSRLGMSYRARPAAELAR